MRDRPLPTLKRRVRGTGPALVSLLVVVLSLVVAAPVGPAVMSASSAARGPEGPAVASASSAAPVPGGPAVASAPATAPGGLFGAQRESTLRATVRDPHYGPDGRLVFESGGDLWVSGPGGAGSDGAPAQADLRPSALRQLTAGPDWDRHPAWSADGAAVVFVSDRSGTTDLWRLVVDEAGRPGQPEPLTSGPDPDTEPAPLPDGGVAFVRGRGPGADLWLRCADGAESRLTSRPGPEASPAGSADGERLAYVAGREVRILELPARASTETTPAGLDPAGKPGARAEAAGSDASQAPGRRIGATTRPSPGPPARPRWPGPRTASSWPSRAAAAPGASSSRLPTAPTPIS